MAFSLVSWNLFNHAPTFESRLELIARTLAATEADVIALQEVPAGSGAEFRIAGALGIENAASAAFLRPDDAWCERLAVLSRLPLVEVETIDLRPGVPNALRVRVATPEGRADVFNVHLHPRDRALRSRELAAVMAARPLRDSLPAVIAGDFNAEGDDALFEAAPGFASAFFARHGFHPGRTFATPLREDLDPLPATALDHVLIEEERLRVSEARLIGEAVEGRWPSDHWGLFVRLEAAGR